MEIKISNEQQDFPLFTLKWTEEYLRDEALKYETREEMRKNNYYALAAIYRRKLTHLLSHMVRLRKNDYTLDEAINEAKKYTTIGELRKNNAKLDHWIRRKKYEKIVYSHMKKPKRWNLDDAIQISKKYKTHKEFREKDRNAYFFLRRRSDFEELTKDLEFTHRKSKNTLNLYYCVQCASKTRNKSKICPGCLKILNEIPKNIEFNKYNLKNYTFGQINKWIRKYIKQEEWNNKIIEIANILNPNIEYSFKDYEMKFSSIISYKCKIHPIVFGEKSLISVFNHKSECVMCDKDRRPNGYWNIETIKSELKDVISKYYSETNIIPVLSVINNELNPGLGATLSKLEINALEFYLNFLTENGFPQPDDALYKDGVIFRGHYEYVGYCFVKSWGINIIPIKKVGKYYSDGYFTDIDTYWEHWGDLNKNNSLKKRLYKKNNLNLFETNDNECAKFGGGYEYLYNKMRDFFVSKGFNIPEYNKNNLYSLLKKEVVTFETTLNWIVGILRDNIEFSENITVKKFLKFNFGGKIVNFINRQFNGMISFKEYVNEHYGFNYPIEKKVDNYYYLSKENLFRELTPIVKKYGRLPSRPELRSEGVGYLHSFIKRQFGGFKNMRRNEIEIGKYFHIIDGMLEGKAPWDLKIDWKTDVDDTVRKIVKYFEDKKIHLPYYFNDLLDENIYGSLGKQLYNVITNRYQYKFNILNWTDFKRKFDNYDGPDIEDKPWKKITIEETSIIGNWTVLKELDFKYFNSNSGSRIRNFLCRCICGKEKEVRIDILQKKNSHCGCMNKDVIDFDKKYGDLKILKEVTPNYKTLNRFVLVKCDCGTEKRVLYSYIKNNVVTNCGCKISLNKQINNRKS
jgi:hypothetical protein